MCFDGDPQILNCEIGFGAMGVTKPYKFIGFGAMEVPRCAEAKVISKFRIATKWS